MVGSHNANSSVDHTHLPPKESREMTVQCTNAVTQQTQALLRPQDSLFDLITE